MFQEGTNTGGVPVLLVVAAFFGYLAVSGQRLTSLKFGDNEARFDRVADRVARDVLEDPAVPTAVKAEVAEALDSYQGDLPARSRRAIDMAIVEGRREEAYRASALNAFLRDVLPSSVEIQGWTSTYDTNVGRALLFVGEQPGVAVTAGIAPDDESVWSLVLWTAYKEALYLYPPRPVAKSCSSAQDVVPSWAEGFVRIDAGLVSTVMVQWKGPQDNAALAEGLHRVLAMEPFDTDTA
ncbi:hypothetical protein [Kribbella jiaozuonensis]|uniref:Uncharacterized protein n=1 Tax=Kribbella jiaozuonensis TaxID=2575441 RepID=A0A4U3M1K9_9ACTN|nr:hypothetical protein [Kribbella jiaozuonensis]TKK82588.1 hypothetical protein FDA38_07365 [Kribbella jiaozuonensis]